MMDGWDGGMGVTGWLLMTVFWVALIAGIVWAVGNLFPSRRDGSTGDAGAAGGDPRPAPRRR